MGAQETLDPLWMDRQPAWRTDTLLGGSPGWTDSRHAWRQPWTGTMLGGQTGTVLGGQTHCLGTLTFSELIASLWENTTEEHSAC